MELFSHCLLHWWKKLIVKQVGVVFLKIRYYWCASITIFMQLCLLNLPRKSLIAAKALFLHDVCEHLPQNIPHCWFLDTFQGVLKSLFKCRYTCIAKSYVLKAATAQIQKNLSCESMGCWLQNRLVWKQVISCSA